MSHGVWSVELSFVLCWQQAYVSLPHCFTLQSIVFSHYCLIYKWTSTVHRNGEEKQLYEIGDHLAELGFDLPMKAWQVKQADYALQVAAENCVGFKCSHEAASSTEFALSCLLQASVSTTELVSCLLPIGHALGTPNLACLQQLLNIAVNCPLCLSSLHGG